MGGVRGGDLKIDAVMALHQQFCCFSNTLNRLFFSIMLLGFYTFCRCLTCNGMPVLFKLLARFPGLFYLLIPRCKVMPSIVLYCSFVLFLSS